MKQFHMCVCASVSVPFAFFAFWLFQLPTNIFLNSLLITISLMKKKMKLTFFLSQYINRMMCLNYILRLLSNQHHFFFLHLLLLLVVLVLLSIHCIKIWILYLNSTEDKTRAEKTRRKKSQFNEQWWWLSSHPILYPLKKSILHSMCCSLKKK